MVLACWWLWKWRDEEIFNNKTWTIDHKLSHLEAAMKESELVWRKIDICELDRGIRVDRNGSAPPFFTKNMKKRKREREDERRNREKTN